MNNASDGPMSDTKLCSTCKLELPSTTEFFNKNKRGSYGLHSKCKQCTNEYSKKYYYTGYKKKRAESVKNNPIMAKYLQYINMLWTYYRLREPDFRDLMDSQEGCCAICEDSLVKPAHSNNNCHVDHCHSRGNVRGLLCGKCNAMIGYAQDNSTTLIKAASYLRRI